MSLAPGTRLGPYAVAAKLGEGGMGEVYRGTETRLGREVAIKVLPPATAGSADALARFEREGRAIAALNHSNICTLFDVGTDGGRSYLVMELLAGVSLHHVLAAGPLPIGALIDHAIALADALHAAHARGIVHRDLKPANVFLTEHGTMKILDFGLAKAERDVVGAGSTRDTAVTHPGTTLGTPSSAPSASRISHGPSFWPMPSAMAGAAIPAERPATRDMRLQRAVANGQIVKSSNRQIVKSSN